jgi:hypothetical protein
LSIAPTFPIFHFAQREQVERAGHGAVTVIGDHDQIGRLFKPSSTSLSCKLAEQFVLRLQRCVIVRRADAVRVPRIVSGLRNQTTERSGFFCGKMLVQVDRHQVLVRGCRRRAAAVEGSGVT